MSVSTLHLASIDRLLTEIADGDGMREAKSLLDHASLLPLLYKHGVSRTSEWAIELSCDLMFVNKQYSDK